MSESDTPQGAFYACQHADIGHLRVPYVIAGEGRETIFTYSMSTDNQVYLPAMFERLTGIACFVVAGWPTVPGIEEATRVGAELLRAAAVGPAIWMGSSVGGSIAQCAAVFNPEMVSGLILSNTALPVTWVRLPARIATGAMALIPTRLLKNLMLKAGGAEMGDVQRDVAEKALTKPLLLSWLRWAGDFHGLSIGDQSDAFLRLPTLILESSDDPGVPEKHRERLKAFLPHATVTTFEGGGHFPAGKFAEEYFSAVRNFVAQDRESEQP